MTLMRRNLHKISITSSNASFNELRDRLRTYYSQAVQYLGNYLYYTNVRLPLGVFKQWMKEVGNVKEEDAKLLADCLHIWCIACPHIIAFTASAAKFMAEYIHIPNVSPQNQQKFAALFD